jgi:hypothetical protein
VLEAPTTPRDAPVGMAKVLPAQPRPECVGLLPVSEQVMYSAMRFVCRDRIHFIDETLN